MWEWLKHFLHFTRGERNAALVLFSLSVFLLLAPAVYRFMAKPQPENLSEDSVAISRFMTAYEAATRKGNTAIAEEVDYNPFEDIREPPWKTRTSENAIHYFVFDPNEIGIAEWLKLGFSEKQATVIEKYKAKGGRFRKAEDLRKLYVIDEEIYRRLAPYVQIEAPTDILPKAKLPPNPPHTYVIDINAADSALFDRQRGIGSALAGRIIRYRNNLGGFVAVTQVGEVWGMPDSVYQALKDRMQLGGVSISKININTADVKTMARHPYLSFTIARVIYNYRRQHGPYAAVADLKKLVPVSDSLYQKVAPYLTVE